MSASQIICKEQKERGRETIRNLLIYGMIYLGSALMICNIRQYVRFARHIRERGEWEQEQRIPGAQLSFLHQPERLAFLPTVRKLRKAFRDDSAAPAAAAGQSAHGLSEFGHPSPYLLLRSSA